MKVVYNPLIPFKGFNAINLFGILFARENAVIGQRTINHESIHTKQMKELLYVGFYAWYLVEWMIRVLFSKDMFSYDAYLHVSFEQEALDHQQEYRYLENRKHFAWWCYLFNSNKDK